MSSAVGTATIEGKLDSAQMRVAWLLPSMRGGYYWQPVLREFTKRFPQTVVFTGDWTGYLPGYDEAFMVKVIAGYRHIDLKRGIASPDFGYRGFHWLTPTILLELRRFQPDILFTSVFSLWTAYAIVYKLFTRSRVIVLLDGISNTTEYRNSPIRLTTRRIMAKLVDASICNSQAGCNYLRDLLKIDRSRIEHSTFYVPDRTVLRSGTSGLDKARKQQHPVFLFIGQLIRRKGWNLLLEAADLVTKKLPYKFTVNIVGDGPDKAMLRDKVVSLNLREIVNVIGRVPYNCLGTYFETADVFVLPSLEDTWGMVVSEAMAFQKPILCSQSAGASELVENGVNGYTFDPRSPVELAGYMELFLREPSLIAKMGACSKRAIANHTPQIAADNLERLAMKLVDQQAAASC